jgi:hypothetical protein
MFSLLTRPAAYAGLGASDKYYQGKGVSMNTIGKFFGRSSSISPEEVFWRWFSKNSSRLLDFEADQERIFDELSHQLSQVHPDLTFEFSPKFEFGREFVISADGIRDAFHAVERLAQNAPELPHWKVVAFRPRRSIEHGIRLGSLSLGSDDLWFYIEADGSKVGLTLYIAYWENLDEKEARLASFLLLDNALGEYDVETKLGFIECKPLPEDPERFGLMPFRKLTAAVDALFASLTRRLH